MLSPLGFSFSDQWKLLLARVCFHVFFFGSLFPCGCADGVFPIHVEDHPLVTGNRALTPFFLTQLRRTVLTILFIGRNAGKWG